MLMRIVHRFAVKNTRTCSSGENSSGVFGSLGPPEREKKLQPSKVVTVACNDGNSAEKRLEKVGQKIAKIRNRSQDPNLSRGGERAIREKNTFGTLIEDFSSGASEQSFARRELMRKRPFEINHKEMEERPEIVRPLLGFQWYYDRCAELAKQGKIAECVAVLEKKMLKQDRVLPKIYHFNVVLKPLAVAGYSKKAFELYHKMLSLKVEPTEATFVNLWNACANSPNPSEGLRRAKLLLEKLDRQGHVLTPNEHYVLIKCFAKHKDFESMYEMTDRVVASNIPPHPDMYANILIGCVSDRKGGFKFAIDVWRQMIKHRVRPTIFHFKLLLRACRDCSVGGPEMLHQLLLEPGDGRKAQLEPLTEENLLESSSLEENAAEYDLSPSREFSEFEEDQVALVETDRAIPVSNYQNHILNPDYEPPGYLVGVTDLNTPQDRFMILGGYEGLFSIMKKNRVRPDIQAMTLMMELLPQNLESEDGLLEICKKVGCELDLVLLNMIIKRRCNRGDLEGAKSILKWMTSEKLVPDEITFGCFAIGCRNLDEATQLLRDMSALGIKPNRYILGSLLDNALKAMDYKFANELIAVYKEFGVVPEKWELERTVTYLADAKNAIRIAEQTPPKKKDASSKLLSSPEFWKLFSAFKENYHSWLSEIKLHKGNPNQELKKQIRKVKVNELINKTREQRI